MDVSIKCGFSSKKGVSIHEKRFTKVESNSRAAEDFRGAVQARDKLEGKNIFYWFQNHKARERQKTSA
uniref:Homeobox domain-containing protein n=1 Tax=Kalanchoe fedtschenkoi TaxID=63787 RepID=A0A7N0SW42_KALFE